MNFLQKIEAIWQNVSIVQRALLLAIALAVVIVGVLLTYWVRRPDMRVLYSSLDVEEAAKITEKISDKDIIYKLGRGGTTIYVPKNHVTQLRLDMAKEGLPDGGQKGYGIFDNEKIGISPFVQSINLKRAIQDELAKSIQMIDGVIHARIHIVNPEHTLFSSQTSQTSASVVLRLKAGYRLSALNIAAITHLIAGSVEGLKSENVTVVDSQGLLLSSESDQAMAGGAGTIQDYKERVEKNLQDKVEEMLTTVLGPGRATVKIYAVIDTNNVSTVTETYEPKGVVTSEEITTNSETGADSASAAGQPAKAGSVKKDETITTEYKIGKTVKEEIVLPGEIKSLSVAAFVDLSPPDANGTGSGGSGAKIMELSEVEEIIRNALGIKETGAIKVVDIKFHRPARPLLDEEPSGGLDFIAIAGQASLGIMAICALLVLKMFSKAKKKAASMPATGKLPAAGATGGLLPTGTESSGPSEMRNRIAESLRSNPEQAKQLFASWLEDKRS
ncbi:MAG: flagellar M-ring protein FliF [Planctomycetes bacterium]|nr:flagellar M-ring protein FliF [Planctomycetota bacterium]